MKEMQHYFWDLKKKKNLCNRHIKEAFNCARQNSHPVAGEHPGS